MRSTRSSYEPGTGPKQEKPALHPARPASRSLLRWPSRLIHHPTGRSREIEDEGKGFVITSGGNKKRGVTSVFANHSYSLARSVGANSQNVVAVSIATNTASANRSLLRGLLVEAWRPCRGPRFSLRDHAAQERLASRDRDRTELLAVTVAVTRGWRTEGNKHACVKRNSHHTHSEKRKRNCVQL